MKYSFILFLLLSISLSAQIKVAGTIQNSEGKSPISFALISVSQKNHSTSSDELGRFSFQVNLENSDVLQISQVGFEPEQISVSDFINAKNTIYLKPKLFSSQTILVTGSIATEGITPISFSKLKRSELAKTYTNQDFPEVLSYLPSVTFYSENGNGLGYNYLSIRGFDQRRISVSINGISQNEPEDHNVYWLDFPDLIENTDLIQVQRGAGSGIVGYPAIGGSVNIITSSFSDKPRFEVSTSLGSYNSKKYSVLASSGLVEGKYSFSAKLSQTLSTGYRNASWVDMKSFYLSAVRFDERLTSQINVYGGPIADGLAYTGLPKFAIKDREARKGNYSYWESDGKNFTYTIDRRPEEIENFSQPHFELLNEFKASDNVTINSALFLVLGNGFFDYDASWADTSYLRLTKENGFNATTNPGNALIHAIVDNTQWGWIPRVSIKHTNGELILGGEFRFHNSFHWGSIGFADNLPAGIVKDYRYYQYEGGNDITNFYANENYRINENINLLLEAQIAYHKYKLLNEKYLDTNFEISNLFFNPRIGINYKITQLISTYITFARVSREPRLKNYYDAAESSGGAVPQFAQLSNGKYDFSNPLVKPETMNNIELGASLNRENISMFLNAYYMSFRNEIVKQGQLDRFGQPVTGNMDRTLHYGLEGNIDYKLNQNWEFILNAGFSKNIISSGSVFVKSYNQSGKKEINQINLENNSIAGFPSSTMNAIVRFNYENIFAQFSAKNVGDYYSDNYSDQLGRLLKTFTTLTDYTDNRVDDYWVFNFFGSYELKSEPVFKSIKLSFQINNLFDNLYASNGIGGEFFPAAERNILFGVKLGL
jgi:iron complex outermembrane recepter protein